jgi:hypothetical protein
MTKNLTKNNLSTYSKIKVELTTAAFMIGAYKSCWVNKNSRII